MTFHAVCAECTNPCERQENHRVHRCGIHGAFTADYKVDLSRNNRLRKLCPHEPHPGLCDAALTNLGEPTCHCCGQVGHRSMDGKCPSDIKGGEGQ